jgi:hypothetical protein
MVGRFDQIARMAIESDATNAEVIQTNPPLGTMLFAA